MPADHTLRHDHTLRDDHTLLARCPNCEHLVNTFVNGRRCPFCATETLSAQFPSLR